MDQKQQKFNFIKNMNQQQQSLVKLGPKGNNPTKYEAAAAKFVLLQLSLLLPILLLVFDPCLFCFLDLL